jgi:hypothetical protein
MRNGRLISVLAVIAMVMTGLIAFSAPEAAAQSATPAAGTYPEVLIKATDYAYDMPDTIPSGYVKITLQNNGAVEHQAQFARVNDGKTVDEVMGALKSGQQDQALSMVTLTGGPNTIAPGQSTSVIDKLDPGDYLVLCFVTTPQGVPHLALGMIKHVTVTESNNQAPEPQADAEVSLKDFTITVPSNIPAGSHLWKVTNDGPESHEMALLRVAEGVPPQAIISGMEQAAASPAAGPATASPSASPAGAPPVTAAGGMGALAPGTSGWTYVNLQPGNYIAICFVPDPKTGKPHFELGMVTSFTVS